mgnify:CR=1 FL=1
MRYSDDRTAKQACGRIGISAEEYKEHIRNCEKWCSCCRKWINRSNFHVSRTNKHDGLNSICKQCNNLKAKKYKEENKDKVSQKRHDKYFANVEESRRKNRETGAKYRKNNPDGIAAISKKYRSNPKTKPKLIENQRRWREKNPVKNRLLWLKRRDADRYIDFDEEQYLKLYEHYASGDVCMCCGDVNKLHSEHIVPIALGGKTVLDNLQFLCKECNSKKHTKTIDYRPDGGEFARSLK